MNHADPAQSALPLPGLEPTARKASDLEVAVRRTLAALDGEGLVHEVDAGKLQLALELAEVISVKKRSGRASTIGNDARVLMEILNDFKEEASEVDADLAATMAAWSEEVQRAADAATEVRDPA